MILSSFPSFLIVKLIFFLMPVFILTSLQLCVFIIFSNKFLVFNYILSKIKEGFFLVLLLLNCSFLLIIFLHFLISTSIRNPRRTFCNCLSTKKKKKKKDIILCYCYYIEGNLEAVMLIMMKFFLFRRDAQCFLILCINWVSSQKNLNVALTNP